MLAKVGTFTKSTTSVVASSPTTTTAVTGVGFQPSIVILFNSLTTATGWANVSSVMNVGFATDKSGSITNGAMAMRSNNAVATSATGKRGTMSGILLACSGTGAETVRATLQSFDSDGFTIAYVTNNTAATTINYIALGGTGIYNANVVSWNMPAANGNFSITGFGFRPDLVLNISNVAALDTTEAEAQLNFGAFDRFGNQFRSSVYAQNGLVASSNTYNKQNTTDFCGRATSLGDLAQSSFVSMDSDGFTASMANQSGTNRVISLGIRLRTGKVGTFTKSTTTTGLPFTQSVTGIQRKPSGLLLCSTMQTAAAGTIDGLRIGIGATSNNVGNFSGTTDQDAAAVTVGWCGFQSAHLFDKNNTDAGTIQSEFDYSSFDSNGFTVNYPATNDAVATEIGYISFGEQPNRLSLIGVGR